MIITFNNNDLFFFFLNLITAVLDLNQTALCTCGCYYGNKTPGINCWATEKKQFYYWLQEGNICLFAIQDNRPQTCGICKLSSLRGKLCSQNRYFLHYTNRMSYVHCIHIFFCNQEQGHTNLKLLALQWYKNIPSHLRKQFSQFSEWVLHNWKRVFLMRNPDAQAASHWCECNTCQSLNLSRTCNTWTYSMGLQ